MKKFIAISFISVFLLTIGFVNSNGKIENEAFRKEASINTNTVLKAEKTVTKAETVHKIQRLPDKDPTRAAPGRDRFTVKVDISQQKVLIYKNRSLIKKITCSTGLPGEDTETPKGRYKINNYFGLKFYSSKYKQGALFWVGFIGPEYLFHSVPTDSKGRFIQSEADKLGHKASHGCIRMSVGDSFWFYETIPAGTEVIIQK